MDQSHTVDELLNLVGRGRIDVSCATDVARAVLRDGVERETINKLASLGAFGHAQSNCERDLHRWLKNLFGLSLQPYTIYLPLKAIFNRSGLQIKSFTTVVVYSLVGCMQGYPVLLVIVS